MKKNLVGSSGSKVVAGAFALLVLTSPALVRAQASTGVVQHTVATGAHFQGFNFGNNGDVQNARLLLIPLTFQSRLNDRMAVDGYAAYASGSVTAGGNTYTLSGPVDSWMRLRWAANRWAVLAIGFALPTGVETHTAQEAVVSNVLANDLLGFREANWGSSASVTTGLSTAGNLGVARVTMGASFRLAGGFQPSTDTSLVYKPGSEARVRLGVERAMSGGTFQGGLTFQQFTVDKADQRNLFQPGSRIRTDLTYTRGTWSFFAADLWRNRGELNIPIINALDGAILRDTLLTVGWQNLIIAGVSSSWRVNEKLMLIPSADYKIRGREEEDGRGSIGSLSMAIPFQRSNLEFFPSVKLSRGSIISASDVTVTESVWGGELSFVIRRATRR